jgi:hypothetical protein
MKAVDECLGIPDNVYVDSSWIKKLWGGEIRLSLLWPWQTHPFVS